MLLRVATRTLRPSVFRAVPRLTPSIRTFADQKPVNSQPPKSDEKPTTGAAAPSDPEFSASQPELNTDAKPSENAPQNAEADAAESKPEKFVLPDLTQGLPSTFQFESTGKSANDSAAQALKPSGINLTEDPTKEAEGGEGGPKRPKGELPASAYVSSSEKKRNKAANYMYGAALLAGLGAFGFLGRNWESEEEERQHGDIPNGMSPALMWKRFRARTGDQVSYYAEPAFKKLLPDVDPSFERPYTLCLSLEDLLIHSEWSREHGWRMAKRPGVDYFLRYLSQYYELVLFTTVPWAMGETVVRKLDPYHIVTWPLFREATMYRDGEYVKDLSYLNRDLSKVIILDTKSGHVAAQPENAIVLPKWTGNTNDKELVSLIPFLEYIPTMAIPDVRTAIKSFEGKHIPTEFALREAAARKKFQEQLASEKAKKPRVGASMLSGLLGIKPQSQFEGEESASEAFEKGKMLQDVARERGMRNYEALEKMIREQGAKWLEEEKKAEEMAKEEGMKAMKSGFTGFFGVGGERPSEKPQ